MAQPSQSLFQETQLVFVLTGSLRMSYLQYFNDLVDIIKQMQAKNSIIPLHSFFKAPTQKQLALLEQNSPILESFIQTKHPHSHPPLSLLTDLSIAIQEFSGSEYRTTMIREFSRDLKFQKIARKADLQSKTPQVFGIMLIGKEGEKTMIRFADEQAVEEWASHLSKHLIEVGFHQQYEVIGKIGKGSTSIACSVRRLKDGEVFAAKVFVKSYLQTGEKMESFFNELQILKVIDHPNILKIYSVIQSPNCIYIITPLLAGRTLLDRINTNKGLTLRQTRHLIRGVLKALAYLHKYGIMHRDLKLENIMLASDQSWEPVLIDFGLAAVSDQEPYLQYRCGTPGYIAPQIIEMQGKERIDVRCDVFSAGVLLHVMLTNKYLFSGSNSQEIFESNKNLSFDLSNEDYRGLNHEALDMLREMLKKDWRERISAAECLEHPFMRQTKERMLSVGKSALRCENI